MSVKTQVLQLRLTEDEKAMIQQQADRLGLSMARYLVMLVLQDKRKNESSH